MNPLRVFDCKVPEDQPIIETLPRISDFLDGESRKHFEEVKEILSAVGVAIHGKLASGARAWITTRARHSSSRMARWGRRTRSSAAAGMTGYRKPWADPRLRGSVSPSAKTGS